jgi:hypothetical protein
MVYRILAVVAAFNNKSSRTRVNGMPFHLWIVFGCLVVVGISSDLQLRDASVYGKSPVKMTVASIGASGTANKYVTVTGPLDTSAGLTVTTNNDTSTYDPLYDPKTKNAILVKAAGVIANASGKNVTVSGMLRPIESDVQKNLDSTGDKLGKYNITSNLSLNADETPTNPQWYLLTLIICGIPALLIMLCVFLKNIIYQKTVAFGMNRIAGATSIPAPIDRIPVRMNGRLTLTPKISQRFLNMSSVVTTVSSGEIAILSNINASISTQFGSLINRSGLWAAVVKPGTLRTESKGNIYLGMSVRPALTLSYIDIASPKEKKASCVLSFNSEDDRDNMWDELQKPTPTVSPRTAPATPATADQNSANISA